MIAQGSLPSDLISLVQSAGNRIGLEIPAAAVHYNTVTECAFFNVTESPDHRVSIAAEARWNGSVELTLQFDGAGETIARRLKTALRPAGSLQDEHCRALPNPIPFAHVAVMKEENPDRIFALYREGSSEPCFLQHVRYSVPAQRLDDGYWRYGDFHRAETPWDGGSGPWVSEAGTVFFGLAHAVSDLSGLVGLLESAAALRLQTSPDPSSQRTLLDFGLDSFVNYPSTDRSLKPHYEAIVHWLLEASRTELKDLLRAREKAARLLKAVALTEFGKRRGLVRNRILTLRQILIGPDSDQRASEITDADLHAMILRFFGDVYQAGHILRKLATFPEAREVLRTASR